MKKRVIAILMTAIMCCLQLAGFVPAEKVKAADSQCAGKGRRRGGGSDGSERI